MNSFCPDPPFPNLLLYGSSGGPFDRGLFRGRRSHLHGSSTYRVFFCRRLLLLLLLSSLTARLKWRLQYVPSPCLVKNSWSWCSSLFFGGEEYEMRRRRGTGLAAGQFSSMSWFRICRIRRVQQEFLGRNGQERWKKVFSY